MVKPGIKVRISAIIFSDNKLVVTKHSVEDYGDYYLLPGGGLELGESPIDAIQRECKEEIGVDVEVKRMVYYKSGYNDTDTYLELIFLCEPKTQDFKISENEKSVKSIEYMKDESDLLKINFFPKQIIDKVFKSLLESAEFLGKFKYPED